MLCDFCGAREATIHRTAINLDVSAAGKTTQTYHYCTPCFEKTFQNAVQPEESKDEAETPHNAI